MKSQQSFRNSIIIAISFLCVAGQSEYALAKQVSTKFAAIYKEMLASALKADQLLVTDMDTVAQTLKEFADTQGHFPDAGDDIASLSLELSAVLPKNPYSSGDTVQKTEAAFDLMDEYAQPVKQNRAQVIYDPSISETLVEKLSLEPNPAWKAKPGTVVAVTNGYDLCLVWGAGIDERPVRDTDGKVRLTVLKSDPN